MGKIISIYLIALLVVGCSETIRGWEIRSIEEKCAEKGGLDRLGTFWTPHGFCEDGSTVFPEKPSN